MQLPKIIARYLPQFHQIPENDKWWGKGFTEWTAVKGAKPLFPGHCQPQIPLDNNYYNLLDKKTMQWQASLAKQYGVDGFAFYHYWFEYGKMVLEKPAENLLQWKEIDIPFCFCWANETWARTWSKFAESNSWNSMYEAQTTPKKDRDVLLRQGYGLTEEWKKHIDYLIPFFQDDRYIKYQGRPVFLVLKPEEENFLFCMDDMFDLWNARLSEKGLGHLFLIAEKRSMHLLNIDAYDMELLRFPDVLFKELTFGKKNGVQTFEYQEYVDKMGDFAEKAMGNNDLVCVGDSWDNTPRYGKEGSVILQEREDGLFLQWWQKIMDIAASKNLPFVFYNAWNEWGEGMALEPSQKRGYHYLENIRSSKIKRATNNYEAYDSVGTYELSLKPKESSDVQGLLEKWMQLRDAKKPIADYLHRNGIQSVAIYGIGMFGKHLIKELLGSKVTISYLIDKNKEIDSFGLPLLGLMDTYPSVDLIIVTPIGLYSVIRREIKQYCAYPMCALEYIINEMFLQL